MKNILITGGPVHAHLDAVKIITNTFKGGFMSDLAYGLSRMPDSTDKSLYGAHITYLCNKSSDHPLKNTQAGSTWLGFLKKDNITVIYHEGFDDYMAKVLEMAPKMDAVILGAAVANLIPYKAIEGKFPSHNYKPGDLVPLIFRIAPRVIDEVKKVAPKTHLFGFKLLDGVGLDELVRAAYGVLLESKATAVIANDKQDLTKKYVVTKERVVHPLEHDKLADWIWGMLQDEYYQTKETYKGLPEAPFPLEKYPNELDAMKITIAMLAQNGGFYTTPEGYIFGTVAKRCPEGPYKHTNFWTTGRGKKELESFIQVYNVNHKNKIVWTVEGKATLNAPLLHHIFSTLPAVDTIIHTHVLSSFKLPEGLPVLDYAPPGTVRDSIRGVKGSFIIKGHGSFLLYSKIGELL